MKTFVRLLTLLLALLMLVTVFVACDDGDDGQGNEQEEDKYGREQDDLAQYNLNYQGDTIKVLNWNPQKPEFKIEQVTSDNVQNALFDRNGEIERRLNVKLEFRTKDGDASTYKDYVQTVVTAKNSNTGDIDIVAAYSRAGGQLAVKGMLEDIKDVDGNYIGWDKPYWPEKMVETVTIRDSVFFISGDISPNLLYMMQVIYFNKDMLDQYWEQAAEAGTGVAGKAYTEEKDEDGDVVVSAASKMIYTWAYEGNWTLDKLIALSQGATGAGIYNDNNGNGIRDASDTYGFNTAAFHIDSFYTGSNLRLLEPDIDETLVISDDYGSFKTVKLVSKLGNWFTRNNSSYAIISGDYSTPWMTGKSIFFACRVEWAASLTGNEDWEYGIMPVPKYDANQTNYYTCMGNPFTLYGIFTGLNVQNNGRSGRADTLKEMTAVLECWCSETYRLVTPEVFEVNMQLKYADTQYETDMFEIIRSSVVYDLGRIFGVELSLMSELPSYAAVKNASWANTYNTYKKSLESKLRSVVSGLFS